MIVWHEMEIKKVKGNETSKVALQESGLGTRHAIGQPMTQNLKGKLFRQGTLKIQNTKVET